MNINCEYKIREDIGFIEGSIKLLPKENDVETVVLLNKK